MAGNVLGRLKEGLGEELEGLTLTPEGLRAVLDLRYGEVMSEIDHDADAASLRVSVRIPPAAGGGPELLVFCLSLNAQYWDVKIGLDDDGQLLVHADLDADEHSDPKLLAALVMDRIENLSDLLDHDLVDYLLERGLGTRAQQARWRERGEAPVN